jgi:Uma2 family endonuclease
MATTAISIDEYLNGPIPDPDVEYVDGELREKSVVQTIHSRLQSILPTWFENHADDWGVVPGVEARVRVTSTRVRLPDVVVDKAGPWPPALIAPPLIVIEILSPSDSFTELAEKLRDYEAMGIPNIWIIDPQVRQSWFYNGSLIERSRLTVADSPIYLDVPEMFARYDRYQNPQG